MKCKNIQKHLFLSECHKSITSSLTCSLHRESEPVDIFHFALYYCPIRHQKNAEGNSLGEELTTLPLALLCSRIFFSINVT